MVPSLLHDGWSGHRLKVCNYSMFCCTLLYVHSSIAIILMGKREPIALLNLSSWCLVMVERLFLAVTRGCLQFVIVVFPDHTHLLFLMTTLTYELVPDAGQRGDYLHGQVNKHATTILYHLHQCRPCTARDIVC